ncbi:MAG: hypothetical protein MK171_13085 [Pirellulales bacterium]|nr:hypothetical protein [Pirellulales bacterium]
MEIFKIRCLTCQASLAVHNRAMLGQIVACPRCGGMVEVQPPHQGSAAATTENLDASANLHVAQAAAPTDGSAESIATHAAARLMTAAKTCQLVTISLAGLFVAASLLGIVLLYGNSSPLDARLIDDLVIDNSVDYPVRNTPRAAPAPALPVVPTSQTKVEEPDNLAQLVKAPATTREIASDQGPATGQTGPPLTLTNEPTDGIKLQQPAATPEESEQAPVAANPPPPKTPKLNPLELDLGNLDLAALHRSTAKPNAEASLRPVFSPNDALNEPSPEPAMPVTTARLVRRSPEQNTALRVGDAAARLAEVIPTLKFKSIPLGDFFRLVSQLSGVPVSVASEQLLMAGITLRKPVSLDGIDISLDMTLHRVLEPLQLKHVAQNGQVIVWHRNSAKIKELDYPIEDLVDSTTSADRLSEWARTLIAPASWKSEGGSGSLEIRQDSLHVVQAQQIHYRLLVFLDQLRLARKIPLKSGFPVQQLVGASARKMTDAKLSATVTFTFSRYTSLDEVFAHWQRELGLPLAIDWPALADQKLWPETRIACAIVNAPWRAALDQVLPPLGLRWRVVAGGMVEITSAEKYDHQLQLAVLPLQTLFRDRPETLMKELQATVGTQKGATMVYDASGNALLALQSAAAQRRILRQLVERKLLSTD